VASIVDPPTDDKTDARRKPISRRLRFEILRRDNNACRYCGGQPPEVKLTIDHVLPVALGGTDDPSNLCAACVACNGGKSSSNPDAATVAQVSEDAVRWAEAMKLAAERLAQNKTAASEQMKPFFDEWFVLSGPGWRYRLPSDAEDVLTQYLAAGMPPDVLRHAARIALRKRDVDDYFRYFRGVANNMLADLQRDAAVLMSAPDAAAPERGGDDLGWHNRAWRKGYLKALEHIQRAESGDPIYREAAQVSAFQYGALSMVVDAGAMDWMASA
jgi:hypothetical protein